MEWAWVFSSATRAVIGSCGSVGSRNASRTAPGSIRPSLTAGMARTDAPTTTACPAASSSTMWESVSAMISPPRGTWAIWLTRLPMVPLVTNRPASLPSSSAARASRAITVGSSSNTSSPTSAAAMAAAEVGDDVFEDDPTVIALEARAAELLGKEAGLFVTSGTMGNLVSQMAHVPRGGEIIAETDSHIVLDEAAGHAVVVGASVRAIPAVSDGRMDPDAVREAFRDPTDPHEPITALVALENTHAHSMGQPLDVAY